jgi:hypothetical protein
LFFNSKNYYARPVQQILCSEIATNIVDSDIDCQYYCNNVFIYRWVNCIIVFCVLVVLKIPVFKSRGNIVTRSENIQNSIIGKWKASALKHKSSASYALAWARFGCLNKKLWLKKYFHNSLKNGYHKKICNFINSTAIVVLIEHSLSL